MDAKDGPAPSLKLWRTGQDELKTGRRRRYIVAVLGVRGGGGLLLVF